MAVTSLQLERAALSNGDEGTGEPVLLLHGFPCTRALWNGVAKALAAAGHRVLTPDLAGYGGSTGAADKSAQADHLLKLFESLGLEQVAVRAMHAIASVGDWPAADASLLFKLLVRRVRTSAAPGRISDAAAREVSGR